MEISFIWLTFDLSNQTNMKKLVIFIFLFVSAIVSAQTAEEIEMTVLVNKVRTNPTSLIPEVEKYITSVKKLNSMGGKMTYQSTGKSVNAIAEANALIAFLKKVKPLNALELSLVLYPTTKAQATYLDSTNQLVHTDANGKSLAERTKSLGLVCGENCAFNTASATSTLVQLLIDLGVADKGHRANIFNPNYKQISVAKVNNVWVQDFTY